MTVIEQRFMELVPRYLGEIASELKKIEEELKEIRKNEGLHH